MLQKIPWINTSEEKPALKTCVNMSNLWAKILTALCQTRGKNFETKKNDEWKLNFSPLPYTTRTLKR